VLKVDIPKPEPMPFDERIPMTWSNADVQEWIKKNVRPHLFPPLPYLPSPLRITLTYPKSEKPPLNPALLAPRENGIEICRLNEDEFVRRALLAKHMSSEKARLLYFKLWTLHIDSRALLQRGVPLGESPAVDVAQNANKRSKKIKPGMFFRLDTEKEGGADMVMVMGREDSKDGNRGYICAAVQPAGHGAYELLVANQKLVSNSQLVDEVVLEYSRETRYYHTQKNSDSGKD
jgi:kinesin family protein 2/24